MEGGDAVGNSAWVRLNVGGKIFQTTKRTLCREPNSFFARLTESNMEPSIKDESGAYLIDRSLEHMDTILNYLRSGQVTITDRGVLPGLLTEADFYRLEGLTEILEKESKKKHSVELVSVINCPDRVCVTLPTCDPEYDVTKKLLSAPHYQHLVVFPGYGCITMPRKDRATFFAARNQVTKVVTSLGFHLEDKDNQQYTFERHVYE